MATITCGKICACVRHRGAQINVIAIAAVFSAGVLSLASQAPIETCQETLPHITVVQYLRQETLGTIPPAISAVTRTQQPMLYRLIATRWNGTYEQRGSGDFGQ